MSGLNSVLSTELPSAARKENDETLQALSDMILQFAEMVDQIEYVSTALNPAGGVLLVKVDVEVRDVNDKRMIFGENVVKRVQLDVTGGSAADGEISNDNITFDVQAILSFKKGVATVWVRASGTGTVVVALTDIDNSGLTLGGDLTVTFS